MAEFIRKHKKAAISAFMLISVVVLLLSRFGRELFVTVYFYSNYDSNEFYIEDKLFYESKNDSDISNVLDWKGIKFPSIVFLIQSYYNAEKSFFIGMHMFSVWDTYNIDIVELETVEGLEQRISQFAKNILCYEEMLLGTFVRISPKAEDGYNLVQLNEFDMEFSGEIPFKMRTIVFETEFNNDNEDGAKKSAISWLMQLDNNNLNFDYVSVVYTENNRTTYRSYKTDYDNHELISIH